MPDSSRLLDPLKTKSMYSLIYLFNIKPFVYYNSCNESGLFSNKEVPICHPVLRNYVDDEWCVLLASSLHSVL